MIYSDGQSDGRRRRSATVVYGRGGALAKCKPASQARVAEWESAFSSPRVGGENSAHHFEFESLS